MAEKLAHDLEWIADRSVPLYLRTLDRDRLPDRRPERYAVWSEAATRLGAHVRDLRNRLGERACRPGEARAR